MASQKNSDTIKTIRKINSFGGTYYNHSLYCENCLEWTKPCEKCGFIFACKCEHYCQFNL